MVTKSVGSLALKRSFTECRIAEQYKLIANKQAMIEYAQERIKIAMDKIAKLKEKI